MHEVTLGKAILKIVLEKKGSRKIRAVRVAIGEAHHLEESSLRNAWQELIKETGADGAVLEIERPALRFSCNPCGNSFEAQQGAEWRCPACESASLEIIGGREMTVLSLEGEDADGD
jgi:Zn finger protein HypA/HybF (possibly regulating hydrogenase expression)